MSYKIHAIIFAFAMMGCSLAQSDIYDVKWIARCVRDNADSRLLPEVVNNYCSCMNNKMDDNETLSIMHWKDSHPQESSDCLSWAMSQKISQASSDDKKWIAQCMRDNADASVSPDVVSKYCSCMNNKMDENETRSISEWEESHPNARAACDRESGWR